MQFVQGFLMVSSVIFLSGMSVYSLIYRKTTGALQVSLLGIFAAIWTIGSFFELNLYGLEQKLFWRDMQQIGVFGLPMGTVSFAAAYTGNKRLKYIVRGAAMVSALSVLLIWTNPFHHIMRSAFYLQSSDIFGQSLVVKTSLIGTVLVAYNFSLPLIAIFVLLRFAQNVSSGYRSQAYWIAGCMAFTFFAAFLRTAFMEEMGIYVHISVLYIPSAIVLFHSLFRYNFFRFSPIARDKVLEVINQGILIMDKGGIILEANSAAQRIARDLLNIDMTLAGSQIKDVFAAYGGAEAMLSSHAEGKREVVLYGDSGEVYLALEYYPLENKKDGSVLILNNVTRQKTYEQYLRKQAQVDALTGLLNRSGFEHTYEDLRVSLRERRRPLSLFMMDLDNFKTINDTYGHATGDKVLVHFARLLRNSLRDEDVIGRIGGEEFAVLLPGAVKEEAAAIAERIRMKVNESVLQSAGKEVQYTVSIGVTDNCVENNCLQDRELVEALVEADSALYKAKRGKKNCTVVYG